MAISHSRMYDYNVGVYICIAAEFDQFLLPADIGSIVWWVGRVAAGTMMVTLYVNNQLCEGVMRIFSLIL